MDIYDYGAHIADVRSLPWPKVGDNYNTLYPISINNNVRLLVIVLAIACAQVVSLDPWIIIRSVKRRSSDIIIIHEKIMREDSWIHGSISGYIIQSVSVLTFSVHPPVTCPRSKQGRPSFFRCTDLASCAI
jgi:hypothetical protein